MPNQLATLRKNAGYSQAELASRLGTTINMLGKLERGDRPLTGKWLNRLADALHCEPSEIGITDAAVPVVGMLHNGEVFFDAAGVQSMHNSTGLRIDLPPPSSFAGCLVVELDALAPFAGDGDAIFFGPWEPAREERRFCLVRYVLGVAVHQVIAGRQPDMFHLVSPNGTIRQNVRVDEIAPIRLVLRR